MKISFFIGSMGSGGAERVISILANHYAKKKWDVDIVVLLNNKVSYELNKRVHIVDFSNKGSYMKNSLIWLKNIRKYVQKVQPDRIVSFIGRINILVLTATLGMDIPVIVSERNDPKHDGRGKLLQMYGNICYKYATAIVFQTNYEKQCFNSTLNDISYVIPNPVSIDSERKKSEKIKIVTAGRLVPQKNQKLMIKSMKYLINKYPEAVLKIYGDGTLKNELKKTIDEQGLHKNIELCGNVKDIHKRIADATMFILSSDYEGLSNALIEAMMMGLPCISTDYPGANEIIINRENGILVPCNDERALSQAMLEIIENNKLSERLSINAQEESQKYKKEVVLRKWEEVIE